MSVYPFKPPFSYEALKDKDGELVYRIRDSRDSAIARTYLQENAIIIVNALNQAITSTPGATR